MSHEIAEIRDHFPATLTQAYLNTGSAGPLSRPAADAIESMNRRQLIEGRSNFSIYMDEYMPMQNRLRGQLARLLNADEDEIALTLHTTNGMNIATWGLRWQTGDEIVINSHEHPGGLLPVYTVARRFGLTVRVVPVDLSDGDEALIEKFRRAINGRTKLVSISHVSWKTGALLPVAEITRIAHTHGALVVVDGAQSGGAIPIDVKALDVDFYAIPGQKWLCGPEGTGALFVRRDLLADLNQTFVGYPSHKALDTEGNFLPSAGAKRFEMGTVYWPGIAGLHASLTLREQMGNGWIYNQIQQITATCRDMLEEVSGVTVVTPSAQSGLLSFEMEGVKADEAVAKLIEQKVVIRSVHEPDLLRVSTSFYNDESDILRLRDGLEGVRSQ
jgi:L-cysteine/cystine lyase